MSEEAVDQNVSVNKLFKDFKVVVQDAEGLIKATAGDIGDKLNERAQEARGRLITSLESAKTSFHQIEDKAVAGAKATDKVIREHPYESVGVAFGVGILMGLVLGRK